MTRLAALLLLLAGAARATTFTVTVTTTGPQGGVVYSTNPATGINCGSTNTACAAAFASGSVVALTAAAASTGVFTGWTGAQGCGTNQPTCPITLTANAAVTAGFSPTFRLSVSGNGLGVVTDTTGVVNCGAANGCTGPGAQAYTFAPGAQVVLFESTGAGSSFVGWTGDAGCNTASTCTFTLNGYETIVATFTSAGPFPLTVPVVGPGTVTSSPAGISCPPTCTASFAANTSVALSTHAAAGAFFAGWANGGCSGRTPCVVVATSTYQGLGGAASPAAFFYKTP